MAFSLVLDRVACERGARTLLEGVDLRLSPGEAIFLRGPNGSGKTTLLRVCAGLSRPAAGDARLEGTDDRARLVDHVAYFGHQNAVKAGLSALANVAFWARLDRPGAGRAAVRDAAEDALEAVGLGALGDLSAGDLSAGQRRRLGFARLLAAPRPVWVLDEPLTGLDASWRARLAARIEDHRRAGGSALIATHDDLPLEDLCAAWIRGRTLTFESGAEATSERAGAAAPEGAAA